jgi:hypothetical protein
VRRKVKVSCAKQCVVMKKKKGKRRPVYVTKRVKVKIKRGNRILTVKRRKRVYKYGRCPASSSNTLGVPVKINILDGSYANLDFGAFQRQAPVSGTFKGFIPGKIQLNSDTQVTLTGGSISVGETPVFIDDNCNGQVSAAIKTGAPATVSLDPTRTSVATLFASGTVTSIAYTTIRLPLNLRNDDTGCNSPYITTGYSEFSHTFFLKGKVGDGGLTSLTLARCRRLPFSGPAVAAVQRLPDSTPNPGEHEAQGLDRFEREGLAPCQSCRRLVRSSRSRS